jgi:zinc protease
MHITEDTQQHIKGITLSRPKERAFFCTITIDTHSHATDARTQALQYVYVKAIVAGTQKYTRGEFLNALGLLGASLSTSLHNGYFTVSMTSTDTNARALFKLVRNALVTPAFLTTELRRIKELVINELREEQEDAKDRAQDLFVNNLYGSHDRRFTAQASDIEAAVKTVTKKDIELFHEYVLSGNWVYTLVGETELVENLRTELIKMRDHFLSQTPITPGHEPVMSQKMRVSLLAIPSKHNIEFSIGNNVSLLITDKDYAAFNFGLQVLGKWGGFAGRLMSTVREKKGLTYGIYARTETVSSFETGYWRIMTFFAPNKALEGLKATLTEIENICVNGVTQSEYERFKTIIATGETLLNDSIVRIARDLHIYQVAGLSLSDMKSYKAQFTNTSLEDVNAALKKYLDTATITIAGAGPINTVEKDIHALCSLAKKTK